MRFNYSQGDVYCLYEISSPQVPNIITTDKVYNIYYGHVKQAFDSQIVTILIKLIYNV